MSQTRRRIDWSFGPGHGPVSGVVNAGLFMCSLTMWMHNGGVPPLWGLTAGVLMAAASLFVAKAYRQSEAVLWYRCACWFAAGVWSLLSRWLVWPSPWAARPLVALVIGGAVFALVGWYLQVLELRKLPPMPTPAGEVARPAPRNQLEEIVARWEPFVRRITRVKVDVRDVELWPVPDDLKGQEHQPPYYGFTLDVELPEGATIKDLKGFEEQLATSSPSPDIVPDGCSVEILPHPSMGRRNILIKVGVVGILGRDIPYPDDLLRPNTIENPQAIGVRGDGNRSRIPIDRSIILVGDTGSGKSTELNNIITRAACCIDTVLVGIDTTGQGQTFRPWVVQFHEGRAERPVFEYVAPSVPEARMLVASLLKIHDGRLVAYQGLLRQHDSDKILPRVMGVPQILLVIDEFKKLPDDVRDMVQQLTETGRKSCIRVVSGALQATTEYIPQGVRKQSEVRACMKVTDQEQIAYLFDSTWKRARIDPAALAWPGTGLVAVGPTPPEQFKGFWLSPKRIEEISVLTAPWRPELDEISQQIGDSVTVKTGPGEKQTFTGVWTQAQQRTYPLIFATSGAAAPAAPATTRKEKVMGSNEDDVDAAMGGVKGALNNIDEKLAALRDAAEGPSAAELNAWFDAPTVEEPIPVKPPAEVRVLRLIAAAGATGTSVGDLFRVLAGEGYPTTRPTIHTWLARWKAQGIVAQGGERAPWVAGPKFPRG